MAQQLSEIIRGWLGWCPNAKARHASPTIQATLPVLTPPIPAGGSAGSGRMDRGFGLVSGSIRILVGKKRLFLFSLIYGFIMLVGLIASISLQYFSGTDPLTGKAFAAGAGSVLIAKGSLLWLGLIFGVSLFGGLCSFLLLAGLMVWVALLLDGQNATFRDGLSVAGNHVWPISLLAVAYAVVGTVQSYVMYIYPENYVLIVIAALAFLPLYLMSLFIIPALIFGESGLSAAVMDSLWSIRHTAGEILMCCFLLGLFFFGVSLLFTLPMATIGFPSGSQTLLGITIALYMLGLMAAMMVGATLIGIITLGLYTYVKTDRLPAAFSDRL